jgi:hypothetical protein
LIFFSLSSGRNLFSVSNISDRDVFHQMLREYDLSLASPLLPAEPDTLNKMLDKLEENTQGVETWLSVLKRRRNLALSSPRFLGQYQDAAIKAASAFPHSEPLAAVAAEAILRNSSPAAAAALKTYASLITEPRLSPLVLGVRILSDGLESPGSAAALHLEPVLAAALPLVRSGLSADEGDRLIADLGILRLLRQDIPGAAVQIQAISAGTPAPALLRFIAE